MKKKYFGKIVGDIAEPSQFRLLASTIGRVAADEWAKIPQIRPDMNIELGEFIIMPDHMHGIICISSNEFNSTNTGSGVNEYGPQRKIIASVIRGYKSAVTSFARQHSIDFAWQPRYYDRIIRSPDEEFHVSNYIKMNPYQWIKSHQ